MGAKRKGGFRFLTMEEMKERNLYEKPDWWHEQMETLVGKSLSEIYSTDNGLLYDKEMFLSYLNARTYNDERQSFSFKINHINGGRWIVYSDFVIWDKEMEYEMPDIPFMCVCEEFAHPDNPEDVIKKQESYVLIETAEGENKWRVVNLITHDKNFVAEVHADGGWRKRGDDIKFLTPEDVKQYI